MTSAELSWEDGKGIEACICPVSALGSAPFPQTPKETAVAEVDASPCKVVGLAGWASGAGRSPDLNC